MELTKEQVQKLYFEELIKDYLKNNLEINISHKITKDTDGTNELEVTVDLMIGDTYLTGEYTIINMNNFR